MPIPTPPALPPTPNWPRIDEALRYIEWVNAVTEEDWETQWHDRKDELATVNDNLDRCGVVITDWIRRRRQPGE